MDAPRTAHDERDGAALTVQNVECFPAFNKVEVRCSELVVCGDKQKCRNDEPLEMLASLQSSEDRFYAGAAHHSERSNATRSCQRLSRLTK